MTAEERRQVAIFEERPGANIHALWIRLRSGSYHPPAETKTLKTNKGRQTCQITDLVAQKVMATALAGQIAFSTTHPSANPAENIALAKLHSATWPWAVTIKSFAQALDIEVGNLLSLLSKGPAAPWVLLYLRRWLSIEGVQCYPMLATPITSVIIYHAFDRWIDENHPSVKFEKSQQAIICHLASYSMAAALKTQVDDRLIRLGVKGGIQVKIVHCKKGIWQDGKIATRFEFLGYTFRPRQIAAGDATNTIFSPAISAGAKIAIWRQVRKWNHHYWVQLEIEQIAASINPQINQWIYAYGLYGARELKRTLDAINRKLVAWIRCKHKDMRRGKRKAAIYLESIATRLPQLFAHWKYGALPRKASKMKS
ncbi:group II intron maturase-specific domain-containing protein [Chitinophaga sp. CC14]|uniref:group II intron maturase-specific domain-containing protein n=1 Tax=Chitinophaga sp. CC14 TaxID=3029199 RepID=UPI003B76C695